MSRHFSVENCLILFSFSLIIIVSLAGNLLVVRCLFTQSRLSSNSTNVLIGMLAISDLIMTTFNIPFTLVDIILQDWIFGSFFCTLVSFVQANSVYVSSFTMAVIAINRWRVVYRFRPRSNSVPNNVRLPAITSNDNSKHRIMLSNKHLPKFCWWRRQGSSSLSSQAVDIEMAPVVIPSTDIQAQSNNISFSVQNASAGSKSLIKLNRNLRLMLVIITICLLAAVHSLPHTVFNKVVIISVKSYNNNHTIRRCVPVLPQLFGQDITLPVTIFTSVTQYFIPLSMSIAIYTRIGATILAQGKVGEMTKGRVEQLSKKKRRRILMLLLIVAIFALCWLPFNIYYLLLDFGITKQSNKSIFLICLWLAMSSVCYNPFVYCWFNEHFQREATHVGQRIKSCLGIG